MTNHPAFGACLVLLGFYVACAAAELLCILTGAPAIFPN